MNYDHFVICKMCQTKLVCISLPDTSPVIMECPKCGHREYAEILLSPPWPPVSDKELNNRILIHRKVGPASAHELKALRQLHPDFKSLTIDDLKEMISTLKVIDMGVFYKDDAQKLIAKSQQLGLQATLEQVEIPFSISDHEDTNKTHFWENFGAPVSVGDPESDEQIIPFVWIIVILCMILLILYWFLFS